MSLSLLISCVSFWLPQKYPLKQSCRTGVQTNPTKYFRSWPKPVFLNLISRTSFGLIKDKMSPNFLQWRPIPPKNFFSFFSSDLFPFCCNFLFLDKPSSKSSYFQKPSSKSSYFQKPSSEACFRKIPLYSTLNLSYFINMIR